MNNPHNAFGKAVRAERIKRNLTQIQLAEKLGIPIFVGLSKAIEKDKSRYYNELKKAQRNLQITDWVHYFFDDIHTYPK